MAFSPAFLEELNHRNPIEDVVGQYVSLTRKGNNMFGLCPFHGEKTASCKARMDMYCRSRSAVLQVSSAPVTVPHISVWETGIRSVTVLRVSVVSVGKRVCLPTRMS